MTEDDTLPGAPLRDGLKERFATRDLHLANAEALQEKARRAESVVNAEAPAAAALAELDSKESAAMLDFLKDGGKQPVADTKRRAKLEHELAQARASAAAARSAQATLGADAAREIKAAEKIGSSINVAVAEILIAEFGELLAAFTAQRDSFVAAAKRLEAAYGAVAELGQATVDEDDKRAILQHLPDIGDKTNAALAPPDEAAARQVARGVWSNLAACLAAGDTSATLN